MSKPITAAWADAARQALIRARADYKQSLATLATIQSRLSETEIRLENLRQELTALQFKSKRSERLATLDELDSALLSADQQAQRMASIEAEIALIQKKLPMLEQLQRQAAGESSKAYQNIGDAERAAWKALAEALKPAADQAALVLRQWRLAQRQASQWPSDAKDVGAVFLEGEDADNKKLLETLIQQLALPEAD